MMNLLPINELRLHRQKEERQQRSILATLRQDVLHEIEIEGTATGAKPGAGSRSLAGWKWLLAKAYTVSLQQQDLEIIWAGTSNPVEKIP